MPASALTIFLSAATADLKDRRDSLHVAFSRAGFRVLTQNQSLGAAPGSLRRLLTEHIDESDCIIHLAGMAYGADAGAPFPEVPGFRCSWTQFEYYYAHQQGKDVIAFVCAENLSQPFAEDAGDLAPDVKRKLQGAHRDRVATGQFDGTPLEGRERTLNEQVNSEADLLKAVAAVVGKLAKLGQAGRDAAAELISRAESIQRLHTIPAPVADFTGRAAELADLRKRITTGHVAICGLRGLGGVGKTQLARRLAADLAPGYPDAQIELDLMGTTTPLTPAAALSGVLRAFHPTAKLPDDEPALRQLYLSTLHGKRALILADDALDAAQVRPLLPPPGSLLLVTTRNRFAVEGLKVLDLDSLREEEAAQLLLRICPRIADHAKPIARACGMLPLALRAAASLLSVRPDIAPTKYLADLADETSRLERIGTEGVEISVEASLNLSYRQLPPDTQRTLRVLSIFPATFDGPAEAAICEDENNTHLGTLLRHSLVEFDGTTQRYHLHDLVRLFARRRLDDPAHAAERLTAEHRHATHYCVILRAANRLYMQGNDGILKGLSLLDAERPNIEAGQSWSARHAETDDAAARIASAYPDAGAYVLDLRLHPRQQIDWLTSALAAARRLEDREGEGVHLSNLGLAHADLGDARKAIECHEQALIISREIGNRRGEGYALGNLGIAHADLGDARKAIEYYEQTLVITL